MVQTQPRQKMHEFIAVNAKIADITHNDTDAHTLDLATALSETHNIVAVNILPYRVSGTGIFRTYPNEGANAQLNSATVSTITFLLSNTNRLKYSLSVANDDFDLYCFGYIREIP